jgi:hypothetical protein
MRGTSCSGDACLIERYAEPKTSVPGRDDSGVLDHEYDSAVRRAGAVRYAARHDETLAGLKLDRFFLQVDQQQAFDGVENSSIMNC